MNDAAISRYKFSLNYNKSTDPLFIHDFIISHYNLKRCIILMKEVIIKYSIPFNMHFCSRLPAWKMQDAYIT